jgi:hypothetical protein
MKICTEHWNMMRTAITKVGIEHLISKSNESLKEKIISEAKGEKETFDPLYSMNNHYWSMGIESGGLYILEDSGAPENDGQYCPLCEAEKYTNFNSQKDINRVAEEIKEYCIKNGILVVN